MRLKRLLNAPSEVRVVQIPNSRLYGAYLFISKRRTSWSCGHHHKMAETADRCKDDVARAWLYAQTTAHLCESLGKTHDGHDLFSISIPDPIGGHTVHPRIVVERKSKDQ